MVRGEGDGFHYKSAFGNAPAAHLDALPGLLLVCRQITDEVKPMIYKNTTLTVDMCFGGQAKLESLFSPETRAHFRNMILILDSERLSYSTGCDMDPEVWDKILNNLLRLGIVVEQPGPQLLGIDEEREKWLAWLTPTLEYINQAVRKEIEIIADTDGMPKATQIVKSAMPGRCNFQILRDGDPIFFRAEWSQESDDEYFTYHSD
jgi:hypothetical protein